VTEPSPRLRRVLDLPRAGRRAALDELVVEVFAEILGIPGGVEFPRGTGFFDLGMNSLRLTEVRQRLTRLLGDRISVEALFEHATVDSLVEHLVTAVLPELARGGPEDAPPEPPAELADLLERLYR
jgi:acyl carrier protein